jgi:hypothetical protein
VRRLKRRRHGFLAANSPISGGNAVYGPGQINFDLALSRGFRLRERWRLEFRSDFFNLMNHGNWGNPVTGGSGVGTSLSSGTTFGQITAFGPPRLIRMAMKLYF